MLPPSVETRLTERVREYWLKRVAQHTSDVYAGIPLAKFPEDLRVYEHLLWESRSNVVIEIGAAFGASALWFRDRLRALAGYRLIDDFCVISVDLDVATAREGVAAVDPGFEESIMFVEGDIRDRALADVVEAFLPTPNRCFVVEDSAHTYETTMAALIGFSPFVPLNGFLVVEDGCVDVEEMRLSADWPRGVLPALHDWLATEEGSGFEVRRDLELYGMSCHPQGFLQRKG